MTKQKSTARIAADTADRLPLTAHGAMRWYKEPWPWLIMAPPLAAVLGGAATLWIAIVTDDGLVAKDYHKQGVAVSKRSTSAERPASSVVIPAPGRNPGAVSSSTGMPTPGRTPGDADL